MKIKIIYLFLLLSTTVVFSQIKYPETIKKSVSESYFGVEIKDDYQWLEKFNSSSVLSWVKSQNKVTKKYLRKLDNSNWISGHMNSIMYSNYERVGESINFSNLKEKKYFRIMYPGTNSPPAIYYKKGSNGEYIRLVSNSTISSKDPIIFNGFKSSMNDRFLAYQYSKKGSDWKEIRIVQIQKRKYFNDVIKHVKSSGIYWLKQGFFYKKYPFDSITEKSVLPKIMYHKLDTKQEEDIVIYETKSTDEFINFGGTSKEDFYFLKKEKFNEGLYSYYYLNPKDKNLKFEPLFENIKYDIDLLKLKDSTIFAYVTIKNVKRIISFPIEAPKKWKFLSTTYNNSVITDYTFLDDKIVIAYHSLNNDFISVVDYDGKILGEVGIPDGLAISGTWYNEESKSLYFDMESYAIPPITCMLDMITYKYVIKGETKVNFDYKNYQYKKEFITSYDGTKVPIFIVYKDSISLNGKTPFLLKTYGGYGRIATPSYSQGVVYFLEGGGAFAYVNVRGGGELGVEWWLKGKKQNKKNTIQDFIAAAEYLIDEGYTSPSKLAVTGTSHGGLVVASAVMKRPELFGSAVINKGALDMIRFENFTVGATSTNLGEFGTVTNEKDFLNLKSYSPYHNIEVNRVYPSMLIITGDSDDRVPPLHSFKFAAKLQALEGQNKPLLLWTQKNAGHYGANKMFDRVEEYSFRYGFLFHELSTD